ncbi:MAG: EcsC family protein [Hahellaceae bacterium]|nr:EcsC family protein [Hahellaceae bacterium]
MDDAGKASVLTPEHLNELKECKRLLEQTSFIMKATNALGSPLEKGLALLPAPVQGSLAKATTVSLDKAMEWAVKSMDHQGIESYPRLHMAAAALSGAVGGAFGLPALALELPVSTLVILRAIADIARANGEDLTDPETRLQCLSVFSMGGLTREDDAAEAGYYALRSSLAGLVSEATAHLAGKHSADKLVKQLPSLLALLSKIAARFKIQVSEKAMAQLVPLAGAAGGAMINTLFMDHFQGVSRGHFTIRRLERLYGENTVRQAYDAIALTAAKS